MSPSKPPRHAFDTFTRGEHLMFWAYSSLRFSATRICRAFYSNSLAITSGTGVPPVIHAQDARATW